MGAVWTISMNKTTGNWEMGTFQAEKITRQKDILSVENSESITGSYCIRPPD